MPSTRAQVQLGHESEDSRHQVFLGSRLEVRSARGVRGADRILLEALDQDMTGRVLVAGTREAIAALAIEKLYPGAEVHLFSLDAFVHGRARETLRLNGSSRVAALLGADLPGPGTFDWVVMPLSVHGDSMLTMELLTEAHTALRSRGKILVSIDSARDRWVRERVLELFGAATIHVRSRHGFAYIARKQSGAEARQRDFRRSFRATLFGRTIDLETRPGVFSHGELDEGTLALSELAAPLTETSRVIDLGCGSGALGIAAALAAPRGVALLADSNARAVQSAAASVERNGASRNALVVMTHDFSAVRDRSFDLALANPPYFGDYRITELFASEAKRMLVPGGELCLVTKAAERPLEIIRGLLGAATAKERRGYTVIRARKA
ncbi:MAG TPA: methyltransferase [Planctomycetota bacterium]|nr:methyltransferase [Planctomycetota bacterium]